MAEKILSFSCQTRIGGPTKECFVATNHLNGQHAQKGCAGWLTQQHEAARRGGRIARTYLQAAVHCSRSGSLRDLYRVHGVLFNLSEALLDTWDGTIYCSFVYFITHRASAYYYYYYYLSTRCTVDKLYRRHYVCALLIKCACVLHVCLWSIESNANNASTRESSCKHIRKNSA